MTSLPPLACRAQESHIAGTTSCGPMRADGRSVPERWRCSSRRRSSLRLHGLARSGSASRNRSASAKSRRPPISRPSSSSRTLSQTAISSQSGFGMKGLPDRSWGFPDGVAGSRIPDEPPGSLHHQRPCLHPEVIGGKHIRRYANLGDDFFSNLFIHGRNCPFREHVASAQGSRALRTAFPTSASIASFDP